MKLLIFAIAWSVWFLVFFLTKSSKPKNIEFTTIYNREKQQILTFKNQERYLAFLLHKWLHLELTYYQNWQFIFFWWINWHIFSALIPSMHWEACCTSTQKPLCCIQFVFTTTSPWLLNFGLFFSYSNYKYAKKKHKKLYICKQHTSFYGFSKIRLHMTDRRPHPPPLQVHWINERTLSQSSDWYSFVNGLGRWQAMDKMAFTVRTWEGISITISKSEIDSNIKGYFY